MATKLEKASKRIQSYLASVRGGAFTESELAGALLAHREEWDAGTRTSGTALIEFALEHLGLRRLELRSEHYGSLERFVYGEYSPYAVALTVRPRGYLTHGSAVFLHALSDQLPKAIYLNKEQSAKPSRARLSQERMRRAFSGRQRTSKLVYAFESYRIVVLSGKHTGGYGVEEVRGPQGEALPVTGVARTLVDIAVRPAYAGGLLQVLEAYRRAVGKATGEEIVKTLSALDYVYPYHQAIGYLMERAGFPAREMEELRKLGTRYEFYLMHGMREPRFVERWRLFVPEGV